MDELDKEFQVTRESIAFPCHDDPSKDGHYAVFDKQGYLSELGFSYADDSKILRLVIDRNKKEVWFSEMDHYPNSKDIAEGFGPGVIIKHALEQIGKYRLEGQICEFCRRSQKEVRKLVMGPTVGICDECVSMCNDIIADMDEPALREQSNLADG